MDDDFIEPSSAAALVIKEENNHASQSKIISSKSFSVEEDEQLCLSWLAIIQGPVACSSQRGSTFWNQVQAHYSQFKIWDNERSDVALMHRWTVIQYCVSRFSRTYSQIERKNRNEKAGVDKILAAKRKYQAEQKKPFTLEHCWHILRGNDKWEEYIKRPTKKFNETLTNSVGVPVNPAVPASLGLVDSRAGNSSMVAVPDAEADTDVGVVYSEEKVVIKKPERFIRKKRRDYDEIVDKLLEQNEAIMEMMMQKDERAARMEILRDERVLRMEDEKVMRADLSGLSERQITYFKKRRLDVLARLKLSLNA